MLTTEQNERFSRVGPGTPMGELMRRYWHPIGASAELSGGYGGHREGERSGTPSMMSDNPTKELRLLGEDMVLFRDASGRLGCIEPRCAHRKAHLSYGIPEANGLRCAYHGWVYDVTGQCVEQPSEPVGSRFKDKIKLKSYPVEELGGLIFVYMGPEPAPLLPRWDILVWDNVTRRINMTVLPCNWLQCMDNSLDPVHFEWLHSYYGPYALKRRGLLDESVEFRNRTAGDRGRHHLKLGFDRFDYGIIKRRLLVGETEEDAWWRIGHPILFPNVLRVGQNRQHGFQYRVPIDDTHTLHLVYTAIIPEPGEQAPPQDEVPYTHRSLYDAQGKIDDSFVVGQDQLAWIIQGDMTDRTGEHLGVTDVGILYYRKVIEEQLRIVEDGGDPINVHRDPSKNECIVLPQEFSFYPGDPDRGGPFKDLPVPEVELEAELAEGVRRR